MSCSRQWLAMLLYFRQFKYTSVCFMDCTFAKNINSSRRNFVFLLLLQSIRNTLTDRATLLYRIKNQQWSRAFVSLSLEYASLEIPWEAELPGWSDACQASGRPSHQNQVPIFFSIGSIQIFLFLPTCVFLSQNSRKINSSVEKYAEWFSFFSCYCVA